RLLVLVVAGEGALRLGDLGALTVRAAREDRGESAGDAAAAVAVVGNAEKHEERAEVRVAEAQRPVVVGVLGDLLVGIAGELDGDLLPQLARLQGAGRLAVAAELGVVGPVRLDGLHELVGDADGVVGVLAADRVVGLAVEVGGKAAVLDEDAGLVLLLHLPVDEALDVGVVHVQADHLGGAAGGAARLDGAGGLVVDLEEAHQAAGGAAGGELLALGADLREVRAGAGAELEDAHLAL